MNFLRMSLVIVASLALASGCGGDDDGRPGDGGGGNDGGRSDGGRDLDAPATDAPATDAPATDAPTATDAPATDAPTPVGCSMGSEAPVGELCVTELTNTSVTFTVYPMGCLSSSCTIRHTTTCAATRSGGEISLDALFCLEGTGGPVCTEDCGGGGSATCSVGIEAGEYTATLGDLSLLFSVPGTLPPGGLCIGSRF